MTEEEKTEIRALIVESMGGVALGLQRTIDEHLGTATTRLERHMDERLGRMTLTLKSHIDEQFVVLGHRFSNLETRLVDLSVQVMALKDQMEAFDRRLDYLVERTLEARTAEASERGRLLGQITELRLRLDALESQVKASLEARS